MITSYYTTKLGLEPETITYKNRVEAYGGEVIDLAYVDIVYKKVKSMNLLTDLVHFSSYKAGVKKDVNDNVSKLFSLDNNNRDAMQTTASSQPLYTTNGAVFSGNQFLVFNYIKESNFNTTGGKFNIDSGFPGEGVFSWGDSPFTNKPQLYIVKDNDTDMRTYGGNEYGSVYNYPLSVFNLDIAYEIGNKYTSYIDNAFITEHFNSSIRNSNDNIYIGSGFAGIIHGVMKNFKHFKQQLTQSQITELNNL